MIDPGHPRLSIVRQCEPTAESEETVRLMRLIDEQFLETPWYAPAGRPTRSMLRR